MDVPLVLVQAMQLNHVGVISHLPAVLWLGPTRPWSDIRCITVPYPAWRLRWLQRQRDPPMIDAPAWSYSDTGTLNCPECSIESESGGCVFGRGGLGVYRLDRHGNALGAVATCVHDPRHPTTELLVSKHLCGLHTGSEHLQHCGGAVTVVFCHAVQPGRERCRVVV